MISHLDITTDNFSFVLDSALGRINIVFINKKKTQTHNTVNVCMKQSFLAILYTFLKHIYWPKQLRNLMPRVILPGSTAKG